MNETRSFTFNSIKNEISLFLSLFSLFFFQRTNVVFEEIVFGNVSVPTTKNENFIVVDDTRMCWTRRWFNNSFTLKTSHFLLIWNHNSRTQTKSIFRERKWEQTSEEKQKKKKKKRRTEIDRDNIISVTVSRRVTCDNVHDISDHMTSVFCTSGKSWQSGTLPHFFICAVRQNAKNLRRNWSKTETLVMKSTVMCKRYVLDFSRKWKCSEDWGSKFGRNTCYTKTQRKMFPNKIKAQVWMVAVKKTQHVERSSNDGIPKSYSKISFFTSLIKFEPKVSDVRCTKESDGQPVEKSPNQLVTLSRMNQTKREMNQNTWCWIMTPINHHFLVVGDCRMTNSWRRKMPRSLHCYRVFWPQTCIHW